MAAIKLKPSHKRRRRLPSGWHRIAQTFSWPITGSIWIRPPPKCWGVIFSARLKGWGLDFFFGHQLLAGKLAPPWWPESARQLICRLIAVWRSLNNWKSGLDPRLKAVADLRSEMICQLCWLMTSWACCVCIFPVAVMSRLFFLARSIGCSLTSTITPWMLVWLASNSLLLGRRNGRHWINLFSTGCLVRPTVDWLTASAGAMWYWVRYSLQDINVISSWSLQLSLAGLPLLVGETRLATFVGKHPH